jgi:hypothetical protein
MRVDLNEEGKLTITAVTSMERYALKTWWSNLDRGDRSSVLEVIYESKEENHGNYL